jgi:hypothetical protein
MLVENNRGDARLVSKLLKGVSGGSYQLAHTLS